MSREVLYEDGSGPRCRVSFDSTYRLGEDDDSYVKIEAIGDGIYVNMRDLDMMIEALREAATLDFQCRAANGG